MEDAKQRLRGANNISERRLAELDLREAQGKELTADELTRRSRLRSRLNLGPDSQPNVSEGDGASAAIAAATARLKADRDLAARPDAAGNAASANAGNPAGIGSVLASLTAGMQAGLVKVFATAAGPAGGGGTAAATRAAASAESNQAAINTAREAKGIGEAIMTLFGEVKQMHTSTLRNIEDAIKHIGTVGEVEI
ncbi:MAG TPA: hypothetical protein VF624_04095 [Tepidisphaeraceae bacterium]